MADVVLVSKVDSATPDQLEQALADGGGQPRRAVLKAESPVTLEDGPSLEGRAVLVVEDGPTTTHGEMAFGAGTVAARQAGATWSIHGRTRSARSARRSTATTTSAPASGDGLLRRPASRPRGDDQRHRV